MHLITKEAHTEVCKSTSQALGRTSVRCVNLLPWTGAFPSLGLWKEYTLKPGCCFHFYMPRLCCFLQMWTFMKKKKKIHITGDMCILYYCFFLRKDILISETRVVSLLITEWSGPSSFALTGEAWLAGSMACAMHTNLLMARLTPWQNSHLQGHISEVLEFAVDIQITDATMEAGAVLPWWLAQSCYIIFHRHA